MDCKIKIGPISFTNATYVDLENRFIEIMESTNTCHQIVVANTYSIVLANRNKEFANVVNKAEFVLADGIPVVWASRILCQKLPERIAGPDFMWSFSKTCAEKSYKVFLLGGQHEYLGVLINNLKNAFPGIFIVGAYSPPFGEWSAEENEKIIQMINDAQTDVLWLGVSTPKQDKWIFENKHRLKTKLAVGVGAAFDFHSGRVKRAPVWMQKIGLEWMVRLIQEPRRMWKRYLFSNTLFLYYLVLELLKLLFKKKHGPIRNTPIENER
jgi:N-acetylglucosaminyldiphosphoundecaprenol N-acetyl-beta-D-mannosaminyltransferase